MAPIKNQMLLGVQGQFYSLWTTVTEVVEHDMSQVPV